MSDNIQQDKKNEPVAFHISFKKTDVDLIEVFNMLLKGDRSEYARKLMRDGLKWRLQNGIPFESGATEIISMTNAQPRTAQIVQPTEVFAPQEPEVIDNSQVKGIKSNNDTLDDDELDSMLLKQHIK